MKSPLLIPTIAVLTLISNHSLAQSGIRPQADVVTNVDVNVETKIELDVDDDKVLEKVEKRVAEESNLEGLANLISALGKQRGSAPIQVITNVKVNVSTTIRVVEDDDDEEDSSSSRRRVDRSANPREDVSEAQSSTETESPREDSPHSDPAVATSKQSAVELKLKRLAVGETIDVELAGKFDKEGEAAEMASKINREKLKWSGRLLALPLVLKSNPESVQTLGKFVASLQAHADGDELRVSASIPKEIVTAVKEVSKSGIEKILE